MERRSVIKSQVLDSIPHIEYHFGTTAAPQPPASWNWEDKRPQWKQVHKTGCAVVQSERQDCGEVDAFFTNITSQPIAVVTADCAPILLAENSGKAVAAIHAGWRGTRSRIVKSVLETIRQQGFDLQNWSATVGPTIGPCCYQVSPEICQEFHQVFTQHQKEWIEPQPRMLDLGSIHLHDLKFLGVGTVEKLDFCTHCATNAGAPRFHSYRRDQNASRQFSAIQLTASP